MWSLVGCVDPYWCDDHAYCRLNQEDIFEQVAVEREDVLMLADTSPGNTAAASALATALPELVTTLREEGVDARIGLVRCDVWDRADAGALLGVYDVTEEGAGDVLAALVPTAGDGPERQPCLLAATVAVTAPVIETTNAGFLRDDTPLRVLAFASADDCSGPDDGATCSASAEDPTPVADLMATLSAADPDGVTVSGLLPSSTCGGDAPRYQAAIDATGGVAGDLCDDEPDEFLDEALGPEAPLFTVFQLSHVAVEDSIEVSVDDQIVVPDDTDGWTLTEGKMLTFHGTAVPPRGSVIDVGYEVAGP